MADPSASSSASRAHSSDSRSRRSTSTIKQVQVDGRDISRGSISPAERVAWSPGYVLFSVHLTVESGRDDLYACRGGRGYLALAPYLARSATRAAEGLTTDQLTHHRSCARRPAWILLRRAILRDRTGMVRSRAEASLGLLGGFELRLEQRVVLLPMTAKRVLAFLAVHRRPVARTYASQSLWLDTTERHADGNLRSALWKIARLNGSLLDISGGELALGPLVTVDLHRSIALAERLKGELQSLDESLLDERMLSEDLLPDWYDDWVLPAREWYRQIRLHGLERLCQRLISLGSYGHAVQAGLAAVAAEPLRESANLVLMQAYVAEGNVSEALRQYRSYQRLLWSELAATPSELRTAPDPGPGGAVTAH